MNRLSIFDVPTFCNGYFLCNAVFLLVSRAKRYRGKSDINPSQKV